MAPHAKAVGRHNNFVLDDHWNTFHWVAEDPFGPASEAFHEPSPHAVSVERDYARGMHPRNRTTAAQERPNSSWYKRDRAVPESRPRESVR